MMWKLSTKRDKGLLSLAVFLNLLNSFIALLPAILLAVLINLLSGNPATFLAWTLPATTSIYLVILVAFLINVTREILNTVNNNCLTVLGHRLGCRMQEQAYSWALIPRKNMDLKINQGDATHRIDASPEYMEDIVFYIFGELLGPIFTSILATVYLASLEVLAFPIILLGVVVIILLVMWRTKNDKRFTKAGEKFKSRRTNIIVNTLANLPIVNLFMSRNHEVNMLYKNNVDIHKNMKKEHSLRMLYWSLIIIVDFMCVFGIVAITAYKTMNGAFMIDNIILTMNYVLMIFAPIENLGWIFGEIVKSSTKINRLYELKPTEEEEIDTSKDKKIRAPIISLEMKNLSVKIDDAMIVSNANMRFERGQLTVVCGKSGSGKTTAISALCGMRERCDGEIIINDKIKVNTMQSYLNRMSITMQSPYIFNRDVVDNILYPNAEENKKLRSLVKDLDMSQLVKKKYDVDTQQDLANMLSGGEKKRICISRGLLKPSEIYVFDEPTNELDNINTFNVITRLNQLKENAIVIVITHDARLVNIADKVISV